MSQNEREMLYRMVDELLAAADRERMANSDEGRDEAQTRALALQREFLEKVGTLDMMRRRVVNAAEGRKSSAGVTAANLPERLDIHTVQGRRKARAIASMALYDNPFLPPELGFLLAGGCYAAAQGKEPIFGNEPGKHGGWMWEPEARMGKPDASTAEMFLRLQIVGALGYEAGVRGLPESKRLTPELLTKACSFLRRAVDKQPVKGAVAPRSPETIKDWCNRVGTETHQRFLDSYADGCRDVAVGRVDASRGIESLARI